MAQPYNGGGGGAQKYFPHSREAAKRFYVFKGGFYVFKGGGCELFYHHVTFHPTNTTHRNC